MFGFTRIGEKEGDDISLTSRQNLWEQIRIGLDIVLKNPFLRVLAMANGVANNFGERSSRSCWST